jgi:small nuclear ribonucleoprotein (snRNP)-like protein
MTNKLVKVSMPDGRWYRGTLMGVDLASLTIVLDHASNEEGSVKKIFIRGGSWETITLEDKPFPIEALLDRIAATFPPGQVKLVGDAISILNGKIKVTAAGVEGTGPTKNHVQKIFDQFMDELPAEKE